MKRGIIHLAFTGLHHEDALWVQERILLSRALHHSFFQWLLLNQIMLLKFRTLRGKESCKPNRKVLGKNKGSIKMKHKYKNITTQEPAFMNLNNLTKVTGELQYFWIAMLREDDIKYEHTGSVYFLKKEKLLRKI